MHGRKWNDAKVMYACLKLPDDPEAGEATRKLIEDRTGLGKWKVLRSLKRLQTIGWVTLDAEKTGHTGRDCYIVKEENHITKAATAWVMEKVINQQHSRSTVNLSKLLKRLKPPNRLSRLRKKSVLEEKISFLREQSYIEDADEPGMITVCDKTIEQRLYIELLAADLRLSNLAKYEFRHTGLRLNSGGTKEEAMAKNEKGGKSRQKHQDPSTT